MKESILLVDDQPIFNFISTKVLEGMGVKDEIHAEVSGALALQWISNLALHSYTVPRLILTDINMPEMDGFTFIHAVRSLDVPNRDQIVLAILSSSISSFDRERADGLGIKYFLTKPISEPELHHVLKVAGVL